MPIVLSDEADQGTVAALVEATFTHLDATSFGILNRLAEDCAVNAETLTAFFGTQVALRPGTYICIDIEVMYVWEYNEATKVATLQRGMLGSIPAAHATGALIQIQPRVSNFDVLKELRNEIRGWPPALYQLATVPLEVNLLIGTRAYDLPAPNLARVLEVRRTGTWLNATATNIPGYHIDYNTDAYPSGRAIVFDAACSPGTVEVVYASPFTTDPWALTTQLSSVGLQDSMFDIPVLGAASRLLREAPRTDTRNQGQSAVDAKVPPGYTGSTRTSLRREADTRIHAEIARLREKYPQRKAG